MAKPVITCEIVGLKELVDELQRKFPEKVKKALTPALRDGAKVVKAEAENELEPHFRTGTLERSLDIRVSMMDYDKGKEAAFIGPRAKLVYPEVRGQMRIKDKKGGRRWVDWRKRVLTIANYLEFGRHNQPARPWLQPAFMKSKDRAYNAIIASLRKAMARWGKS